MMKTKLKIKEVNIKRAGKSMRPISWKCKLFGHNKSDCLMLTGGLFSGGLIYFCFRCGNYLHDYMVGIEDIETAVLDAEDTARVLRYLKKEKKPHYEVQGYGI